MHAFTVHPQKKEAALPESPPRRQWRRWVTLSVLLLSIGGLAWAVRPDPHLARAKELQKELFSPEAKNLSPEERKARFTEYREQMKHLTDDQKWELSAPMREKQKAEMDRYFALSPKEKIKYLDERIDRSEKMRKDWEQKAAQAKANGTQVNAGGAPGKTGFGLGGGPGGSGGPGGTKTGGPGGKQSRSADEVEARKKKALERTTPEERAKMDQFRKDMNDRRKARGLPVRA